MIQARCGRGLVERKTTCLTKRQGDLPSGFLPHPNTPGCSSLFSVAVINTRTESSWRETDLFGLHVPITVHQEGKSGWKLKAGTDTETVEEHCLLTCSSWPAQSGFLYNVGSVVWG